MSNFKIIDINSGFCQITYSARNDKNERIFYGLQDNGEKFGGVRFMRCTQDCEPSYEVKSFKPDFVPSFEIPVIDAALDSDYTIKLKTLCIEFLAVGMIK